LVPDGCHSHHQEPRSPRVRPGGLGRTDIWRAKSDADGRWRIENLGPAINTSGDEYEPLPSPDGLRMLVMADGGLYETRRLDGGLHPLCSQPKQGLTLSLVVGFFGPMHALQRKLMKSLWRRHGAPHSSTVGLRTRRARCVRYALGGCRGPIRDRVQIGTFVIEYVSIVFEDEEAKRR